MSHSFDFVGLNEKLFLLRHLISGIREYCRKERLVQGPIDYEDEWSNYYLRLRYLVSNDLIESAAKLRVIQDTSLNQLTDSDIRELDAACRKGQRIGLIRQGDFALTLRESLVLFASIRFLAHFARLYLRWLHKRNPDKSRCETGAIRRLSRRYA